MNKITAHQILTTYNVLADTRYTDQSTEVQFAVLDSLVASAWAHVDPDDIYSEYVHRHLRSRAAVQCLAIVRKAPFPDRNIEVAVYSTLTLLELNNYNLPTPSVAQELFRLLSNPTTTEDDVRDWISANVTLRRSPEAPLFSA